MTSNTPRPSPFIIAIVAVVIVLSAFSAVTMGDAVEDAVLTPKEPIAELESVSGEKIVTENDTYCVLSFEIEKQRGVFIQVRHGVESQFLGNGEYHYQQDTDINQFKILSGGDGRTVEINAYDTPTDGQGRASAQLFRGEMTDDCLLVEASAQSQR